MSAVLSDLGIIESRNDMLTMSVIVGILYFFKGSPVHDEQNNVCDIQISILFHHTTVHCKHPTPILGLPIPPHNIRAHD